MGKGWKARDPRLDRMVAVKLLKTGDSARFIREARAVAALNHPNICQICEAGPDHLLMEYIEGKPLRGPSAGEALRIT